MRSVAARDEVAALVFCNTANTKNRRRGGREEYEEQERHEGKRGGYSFHAQPYVVVLERKNGVSGIMTLRAWFCDLLEVLTELSALVALSGSAESVNAVLTEEGASGVPAVLPTGLA